MKKLLSSTALLGVLVVVTPALAAEQSPQQSAQRLCQEWSQAFNNKDANGIASLFTQDGVDVTPTAINESQDQIRRRAEENFRTMTNFRCTVDKVEGINNQGQIINAQGQPIPGSSSGSSSSSQSSNQTLLWAVGSWGVQNRNQQGQTQPVEGYWTALYQVQNQTGQSSSSSSNQDIRIRMLSYNQKPEQSGAVGSSTNSR